EGRRVFGIRTTPGLQSTGYVSSARTLTQRRAQPRAARNATDLRRELLLSALSRGCGWFAVDPSTDRPQTSRVLQHAAALVRKQALRSINGSARPGPPISSRAERTSDCNAPSSRR